MPGKSSQLQIRVTPEQKRALKRLARQADLDLSSWVLGRLLPSEASRFQALARRLADSGKRSFALAELDPATLNHLAGTLELAARRRRHEPPRWTDGVRVPVEPVFGSSLGSVRLHLLTRAPVALRRRNLFMDASIGDRV